MTPPRPALNDALTRNAVFVERLKAGEIRKFDPYLAEIDRNIRDLLTRDDVPALSRSRLEELLTAIANMMHGVQERYTDQLRIDLQTFAVYQSEFAYRALNDATPADVAVAMPTAEAVATAVLSQPLHVHGTNGGKLLESFIADWSQVERDAVTGAIRLGMAQGQTTAQIIRRIRGSRALNYADGLLDVTRRHAAAIVQTAIQHAGDAGRQVTYFDNGDIVKEEQWVSTLDSHTTQLCRSLDGLQFPVGEGIRPPAHINCRSIRVPVLSSAFEAEFANAGFTRASSVGQVDAKLTYYEWLKSQPALFQDQAIGPVRAKLFRDGGLSVETFAELNLGRNFEPLTLDEMRALEPLAFERAGI